MNAPPEPRGEPDVTAKFNGGSGLLTARPSAMNLSKEQNAGERDVADDELDIQRPHEDGVSAPARNTERRVFKLFEILVWVICFAVFRTNARPIH